MSIKIGNLVDEIMELKEIIKDDEKELMDRIVEEYCRLNQEYIISKEQLKEIVEKN